MHPLYDLSPAASILLTGLVVALLPILWVLWRSRHGTPVSRLRALTLVTLFLTFDLVVFGAFTRLSDSGLGCPDWPGCYGNASPLGAHASIAAAQFAMPTGPVTHGKAWIEMVHRYLATGVGALIATLTVATWWSHLRRSPGVNPWWPTATLLWVSIQGAFGALTVTMKLFPAVVSMHLMGGYILLALLALQAAQYAALEHPDSPQFLSGKSRMFMAAGILMLFLQALSGAWVSTNYAVLACDTFPLCQGSWWPQADFAHGFVIWRPLGMDAAGANITFQALTAIHLFHRTLALLTILILGALVVHLRHYQTLRRPVRVLGILLVLQALTGISNVVLDWPLAAALMHTAGAGAMLAVLVGLLCASRTTSAPTQAQSFFRRQTS